jgi:hypothetical protein
MKSHRFVLAVVLMSLATVAFAQSDAPKSSVQSAAPKHVAQSAEPTDSQKSFTQLKTLAGNWQASITTDPPQPQMGNGTISQVSIRVTSRGNALVHEVHEVGKPDDPTRYDHPLTMFYLDGDRLLLTHYCDAGNRPRMMGKMSPDGKTLEFDFLDIAGGTQYGHMHHAVFTMVDANHHTEDWTYMMPGDKPLRAHFDLQRTKEGSAVSDK